MAKKKITQQDTELGFDVEEAVIEEQGPVTCLGMTFANDEERRQYFRDELRKKLPELRQIEGFPIGEDEDIINLSDPPYYTACPNPWLNDFINQWEEEKKQLVADGKRVAEKIVTEPYASDVSEGKNNFIYMAHAYHTKVPHPAIMRYILHYTQPGDIIFDGFAGTGMTAVAANLCGLSNEVDSLSEKNCTPGTRHGICSDLSPIASLINASYTIRFDLKELSIKAEKILEQVDHELGWMFETVVNNHRARVNYTVWSDVYTCPSCGSDIVSWDNAVDLENGIILDSYPCPHCGSLCSKKTMQKTQETTFDNTINESLVVSKKIPVMNNVTLSNGKRIDAPISEYDKKKLLEIESLADGLFLGEIPDGDESSRNFSLGLHYIHQLFTHRNHIYLTRILELVRGDVMLTAWFTSVLQNASKLYKFRMDRKGGIVSGTLFIPSYNIEQNPSRLLRSKLKDFSSIDYLTRGSSVNSVCSATKLAMLADNTIDYIFIDPPFGSNLMYSELNSLWEGWLRVKTDTEKEAIVNTSQHKDIFEYQSLMHDSLNEFYRVLKPGKWLTMEFSNTSASVWNSIQNALQGVGFIVANVAALDKKQGSFKAVTTTTAVKQDLVITCYKPSSKIALTFEHSGTAENVWTFIDDYLLHLPIHLSLGNSTTVIVERSPKILYDRVVSYYVQKGFPVPLDAQQFQDGLRSHYIERDGMFFTAQQAAEYEEKRKNTSDFVSMGISIGGEADGIAWLHRELETPKTYQELQPEWMKALVKQKKGDMQIEMATILEENFIQMPDGKWRLPDPEEEADHEILRIKGLMREFAKYAEIASKPQGKIRQARLEALREGFKQCWQQKAFETIVNVGDKIPEEMLQEDEVLLRYYDIALRRL